MSDLPRIGLTMGDAAGIGPEIIVKALSHADTYQFCSPFVIGSVAIIEDALRFAPRPLEIRELRAEGGDKEIRRQSGSCLRSPIPQVPKPPGPSSLSSVHMPPSQYGTVDVLNIVPLHPTEFVVGKAQSLTGEAAVKAIKVGTQLALNGQIDAIATPPICKAAVHLAGYSYPGHTEMLAELTGASKVIMMLAQDWLRVSFVTNHLPLAEVPKNLSVEKILDVISVTHDALLRLGIISPKLVVAALNPHAGESGVLGDEEAKVIVPAVERANASGYVVEGPLPADTLFVKVKDRRWDAVIAMYHDQGNIPIKLMGFGHIVNVTLGLPIIRTSVDHGTAFDIAGRGIASESSLIAALRFAAHLARLKMSK